jgi:hypothetical protein
MKLIFICAMRYTFLFIAVVALYACSPVTMVKPLKAKQWAATGSFGGPLIGFGSAVIPVPFTALGAGYGLDSVSTISARVHTTSAAFGVAHLDVGYLRQLRSPEGRIPGITASLNSALMLDKWEKNFSWYPSLDVNAYWNIGKQGSFLYTGVTSWFDYHKVGTADRVQPYNWVPAVNVGYTRSRARWNTSLEVKYLAPGISHESLTVDYKAPGSTGAIGVYVGIIRTFGNK